MANNTEGLKKVIGQLQTWGFTAEAKKLEKLRKNYNESYNEFSKMLTDDKVKELFEEKGYKEGVGQLYGLKKVADDGKLTDLQQKAMNEYNRLLSTLKEINGLLKGIQGTEKYKALKEQQETNDLLKKCTEIFPN